MNALGQMGMGTVFLARRRLDRDGRAWRGLPDRSCPAWRTT